MLIATTWVLVLALILILLRAFLGPTLFDRVLAVNIFGTTTVLLLTTYSFLTDQTEILDIAITYALVNFIGLIALLRFSIPGADHAAEDSS